MIEHEVLKIRDINTPIRSYLLSHMGLNVNSVQFSIIISLPTSKRQDDVNDVIYMNIRLSGQHQCIHLVICHKYDLYSLHDLFTLNKVQTIWQMHDVGTLV